MTKRLENRLALVTGASRGIGYALARAFAREGAHVVALARTVGGLEELDDEIQAMGGSATLVPVDLKDVEALDRLGGQIHERWGKLDIFAANAGVLGRLTPLGHLKAKEWDEVMAVNVTANWRLVRSLDPLLRASDAGRAIFLSSGAAHKCKAYWGAYSVSKAALEALARTYAAEVATTPVRVSIVNPGATRTAMRARAMPGEDPETLPTPADVADTLVALAEPGLGVNGGLYDFADGRLTIRSA
ncbi:SDR family NAD(P)-dependent oxidoreductase [Kaustia mangrovi]|uniref:SDR family NAD(P)-dependent oxidoreductase n=1 Tax=Kaustia mangrovi TaxID=2593653 RepID=A0A7S8C7A7_9HYPH|nr:SDR family NAD(P)-dependent oxidoreductase [Kaustia mangrovi]QPC44679.1 SDR family NAD(P)-dependent oxidoreductase [Kaustia mangrovi]